MNTMYPIRKHNASIFVSDFASSNFFRYGNNLAMENRLRFLRNEAKLSLDKLGGLVGSTRSTIQKLETDKMEMTVTWMKRLGKALHVDPLELVTNTKKSGQDIDAKLLTNCFISIRDVLKESGRNLPTEYEVKATLRLYYMIRDGIAKGEDIAPSKTMASLLLKQFINN